MYSWLLGSIFNDIGRQNRDQVLPFGRYLSGYFNECHYCYFIHVFKISESIIGIVLQPKWDAEKGHRYRERLHKKSRHNKIRALLYCVAYESLRLQHPAFKYKIDTLA